MPPPADQRGQQKERTFRAEQRTERSSKIDHREDEPTIGEQCSRTQLANASTWESPSRNEKDELLRKEVIQPHLPVRLPCYDFTPIADPTFDSSLSCELGHWLRVLPTFVV